MLLVCGISLLVCPAPSSSSPSPQQGAYFREDDTYFRAGNDTIELVFQKGDGRLYSLLDKVTGRDYLSRKEAYWGPWHFWATVDGKLENIFGGTAHRFTYQSSTLADSLRLTMVWEQFGVSRPAPLNMSLQLTIDVPPAGGLTDWRIAISNSEDLVIQRVDFPYLDGFPQLSQDPQNDYLVYPTMGGLLFQDPFNNILAGRGWGWELFYPSAYMDMQFTAYYSTESHGGFYLAAYDPDGNSKFLSVGKTTADRMSLSLFHQPTGSTRADFSPQYRMVVGLFSGGWYDAAQIYRQWAVQQSWVQNSSLWRNDSALQWYRDLPLHRWVHSYSCCQDIYHYSVLPGLAQETAETVGAPAAMDWVGWERVAWYVNYPDVYPPKEGWNSFDSAVADVKALGNRVWVVPNVASYSSRLPAWNQAKQWAKVSDSGGYPGSSDYTECGNCGLSTTFFQMCPATQFWQDQLRTLVLPLALGGADIVQLDGFPVVPPAPCAAPDHGHVPGGGNWQAASFQTVFDRIKTEARTVNPRIAFSTEGMAETYLGFLDSVSDPFTTGWSPAAGMKDVTADPLLVQLIPLWHAVYHDAALIQSGLSLFRRADVLAPEHDYYIHGLGRALTWGEVPAIAVDRSLFDFNAPDEELMKLYLRRIVQARLTYAEPFLVSGRMLRPPAISVPDFAVPEARDIPYTGQYYPPSTSPSVLGSLWTRGPGDSAYVFTNISHATVTFSLNLDPIEMGLTPAESYEIYQVRNGESSLWRGAVSLPLTQSVTVEPLDVLMIRVSTAAVLSSVPHLSIGSTHTGSFFQGQTGATYSVTVSNDISAAATSGEVTVGEVLPVGLALVSMSGDGWTCSSSRCSRDAALHPGDSYPPIAVKVKVAADAPSQLTNQVNSFGGGSLTANAGDPTTIVSGCDADANGNTDVADVHRMIDEALGIATPVHDLNQDGMVNVVEVQRAINGALGYSCAAL